MAPATAATRIYREGDPDIPQELVDLLKRMLVHHLENSTNPHYTELLGHLWLRGMSVMPEERLKTVYAKLMQQEVEHGVITSRILAGLGVDRVDDPIKQYLF